MTELNISSCLRDVTRFGYTEVHNVCTGAVTYLDWGLVPWIGAAFLCAATLLPFSFYVFMQWPIWRFRLRQRRLKK